LWPKVKAGGIYLIEDCHSGVPYLYPLPDLVYAHYPWVVVLERPKRMLIGSPSRPLNELERRTYGL
jgi:hypothetical protein